MRSARALAGAAVIAIVCMPAANAAATRAGATGAGAGGGTVASGEQCEVQIARDGRSGGFDVTRRVLTGGGCLCQVSAGRNGPTDAALGEMMRLSGCGDAPPAIRDLARSGGLPGGLAAGLGGAGAAAAAVTSAGRTDSPGG